MDFLKDMDTLILFQVQLGETEYIGLYRLRLFNSVSSCLKIDLMLFKLCIAAIDIGLELK